MVRQTFNCTMQSMRMDSKMAKAKDAPICTVNVVVCVKKPGPTDEVAIMNTAASKALRTPWRAALLFKPAALLAAACVAEVLVSYMRPSPYGHAVSRR